MCAVWTENSVDVTRIKTETWHWRFLCELLWQSLCPVSVSNEFILSLYYVIVSSEYIQSVYPVSMSNQCILSVYLTSISTQYLLSV